MSSATTTTTTVVAKSAPKKNKSLSQRAGLQFPVGRVHRLLKTKTKQRVAKGAAVFTAAVLEYMTAEVLELSGNAAKDLKHRRITPRDIRLAIGGDEELAKTFEGTSIAGGGVIPQIHRKLLPKKKGKKALGSVFESS